MERAFVKRPEGYIHYRSLGEGRPLILLHPVMWSSTAFLEIMPYLAKKFRGYAIDNPGYGDSDPQPYVYSIADYARAVTEFMAGVGVIKASIFGDAFGGILGMEVAARYPAQVERLIVMNTPFYANEQDRKQRQSAPRKSFNLNEDGFPMPRTLAESLERDPVHVPMNPTDLWMERTNTDAAKAGKRIHKAIDVQSADGILQAMELISCPTLSMFGEHFYYRKFIPEYTSRIKNSQAAIIEGGRWMPQVDLPERVSKLVTDFLGGE